MAVPPIPGHKVRMLHPCWSLLHNNRYVELHNPIPGHKARMLLHPCWSLKHNNKCVELLYLLSLDTRQGCCTHVRVYCRTTSVRIAVPHVSGHKARMLHPCWSLLHKNKCVELLYLLSQDTRQECYTHIEVITTSMWNYCPSFPRVNISKKR
jgi:hypothetical protein